MPSPMMGRLLAVQEITTSKFSSCWGRSDSAMVVAPKRSASGRARSSVRLAMTIRRGWGAQCAAHSSIISPAPMSSTEQSARFSKICSPRRTLAADIETDWAPMAVWVRTSLATENERWNSWCRWLPSMLESCATRAAVFIWPRIWGSPSTMESSPLATRKAWRTAPWLGSRYRCSARLPSPSTPLWRPIHSVSAGPASSGASVLQ